MRHVTGNYLIVEWWCTIDFVVRESFTSPGFVHKLFPKYYLRHKLNIFLEKLCPTTYFIKCVTSAL